MLLIAIHFLRIKLNDDQFKSRHAPPGMDTIGDAVRAHCSDRHVDLQVIVSERRRYDWRCSLSRCVDIPRMVTIIEGGAFYECGISMTNFGIPASVTSIDKQAFAGCGGMKSALIPSTVTALHVNRFEDCNSLKIFMLQSVEQAGCATYSRQNLGAGQSCH